MPLPVPTAAGPVLALGVLSGLGFLLIQARSRLAPTTLLTAWWWMAAVWLLWGLTAVWLTAGSPPREMTAQVLYWTGIVALCPGIAVLGAKRPGSRVWNLFILLPLLLVLGWPAVTVWRLDGPRLFAAEIPVLVGLLLVLVMGTGNYLGTRFGGAAFAYGLAVVALIAPATVLFAKGGGEAGIATPHALFLLATLFLGLAGLLAWRAVRRPPTAERGTARLWVDFREAFGIVWSRRLQDRLNQEGSRENWTAVVGPLGLEWPPETPPDADQRLRVDRRFEHHLLWLLRRFVDRPWVELRSDVVLGEQVTDPGEAVPPRSS